MAFCCYASVNLHFLSPQIILAFLEFLTFNKISHSGIINFLSAIKTKLSNFGLDTTCFQDPRIKIYSKAILHNSQFNPNIKSIIDIPMLTRLVKQCETMHMGTIFKAAFLTSFFSFLRISYLVPHSISSFDHMKQLARADVISLFTPSAVQVPLGRLILIFPCIISKVMAPGRRRQSGPTLLRTTGPLIL